MFLKFTVLVRIFMWDQGEYVYVNGG
jgi:hypothetical protein